MMRNLSRSYINSIIEKAKSSSPDETLLFTIAQKLLEGNYPPATVHSFLKAGHLPLINKTFYKSDKKEMWIELLISLTRKSNFHVGNLIMQRVGTYPQKALFQIVEGKDIVTITYKQAWKYIWGIAKSLSKSTDGFSHPVIGILTTNSLYGALLDLACLSFNFRIVPIPINLSKTDLNYILDHAGITHLFIGGAEPHNLFNQLRGNSGVLSVTQLPDMYSLDFPSQTWEEFLSIGKNVPQNILENRLNTTENDEVSTVMYTSGTTANPKGIIFTQMNIISKRFSRAIALPDLSSNDIFLSYLPLYHTFGRYLEMIGTIFWGATYAFAESPAYKTLLKNFSVVQPTVFISIPKRWIQLYEQINNQTQQDQLPPEKIKTVFKKLTGGKLKLGLSAAGYLDPDIFEFYQKNGIHLLSGYGMTEATGGITMTPVNDYLRDSVGKPLPGIETKITEDGELLICGPYVSPGYFGEIISTDYSDNWFHTGDIFKRKKGHLFIIGRKKEIYKNNRGQTISPQKIENLFQDFDTIKSVFLVGDGREYNTVLLYPKYEQIPLEIQKNSKQKFRDYFGSLVQSVNSFLAPYERIVNYAIIQRDFSEEYGELTRKETYKRNIILKNFTEIIDTLYEKIYTSLMCEGFEIRIPNWLIREKGVIPSDILWDGKTVSIRNETKSLVIQLNSGIVHIGDFSYIINKEFVDLETLMISPYLWVGNQALVDFIGSIVFRISRFEITSDIQLNVRSLPWGDGRFPKTPNEKRENISQRKVSSLQLLHESAIVLHHPKNDNMVSAMNHLHQDLENNTGDFKEIVHKVLLRLQFHPSQDIQIKSLEYLLSHISGSAFLAFLTSICERLKKTDNIKKIDFDVQRIQQEHFDALLKYVITKRLEEKSLNAKKQAFLCFLLKIIAIYGVLHPKSYIWARVELVRWELSGAQKQVLSTVKKAIVTLTSGFREWVGVDRHLAIDPDTDDEYSWGDTILFEKNVEEESRKKLMEAMGNTVLLQETIFLLSNHRLIRLEDIPKNGIWVSFLGSNHGKSVFRVLVQTRSSDSYNFVINLDENLGKLFVQDEIRWLITTGSSIYGPKLVEDFGGYWSKYGLYTEEYIPGETLYQHLERNREEIESGKAADRWQMQWLHFVWNGLMAYMDFWYRTGYVLYSANPSTKNLIIPRYDYATGTRLISISDRKHFTTISDFVFTLYGRFIITSEQNYPGLKRMGGWEVLFTALLQVVTVKQGLEFLMDLQEEFQKKTIKQKGESLGLLQDQITSFIDEVNENGILTKQVVFASLRYQRWFELNPKASVQARGSILQELYKDYCLRDLLDDYPETRIRFFLMSCFKDSNPELIDELFSLQKKLRARTVTLEDLGSHLHHIHENITLTKEEEFFLTRLLFEHLDAAEEGELIVWETGSKSRLDLISLAEDSTGERYRIRPPFKPKEIARFHSLLGEANLPGIFQPQHEFLLLINSNNQMVGGVYWKKAEGKTAYIEKIVIRYPYRKRHLSLKLLKELFNRLRDQRYKYVTIGFFQAGLFYKLGFQINQKFGGLVKEL